MRQEWGRGGAAGKQPGCKTTGRVCGVGGGGAGAISRPLFDRLACSTGYYSGLALLTYDDVWGDDSYYRLKTGRIIVMSTNQQASSCSRWPNQIPLVIFFSGVAPCRVCVYIRARVGRLR